MANPPPLDAAARDELARKAKAAASDPSHWYGTATLQYHGVRSLKDAEFLAACTPDVILALLAAAERGEEDTALMVAVDAFLAKHPAQIGSKSNRPDYGSFITAADLWALHEARLTARRDMEMSMPAFADLPPESRAELEEFTAHLRQHREVASLDCRFCLLRLARAARSATPTEGDDHA